MSNKDKKHNNQFKENTNHGEHRNGRLSQTKNHSDASNQQEPNEFKTEKQ